MKEPLEARLRRLKAERDEADRRYNEALTDLDRALPPHVTLPEPVSPLDDERRPALNDRFNILPASPAAGSGWQRKLTGFIWRTVAPYLERQVAFNAALVEHINRNAEAQQQAHRRALETAAALRAHLDALHAFQARLMLYLQQITGYVDTKDRDTAGGTLVLNEAISGLAEAHAKYRESLEAREHRYAARTSAIAEAHEELRGMLGIAQQSITALRRHVEEHGPGVQPADAPGRPDTEPREVQAGATGVGAFAPSLDAYKYLGFEDQFRGSQSVIRARQESYVPFFERLRGGDQGNLGDVLDIGCGRGEFIDLLDEHGIPARGIDLNAEMAEVCRARGLNVIHADAVAYLNGLKDGSLGGIFAAQVVEHLEPSYLLRLLDLAFEKLQPGGTLLLETLNPACWTAFFESYIRDITHRWPLHPETLRYLVTASGFTRAAIEFRSPLPPQDRLEPIAVPAGADAGLADLAETFNHNVEKLNARMFTYMDYAIVAQR